MSEDTVTDRKSFVRRNRRADSRPDPSAVMEIRVLEQKQMRFARQGLLSGPPSLAPLKHFGSASESPGNPSLKSFTIASVCLYQHLERETPPVSWHDGITSADPSSLGAYPSV